MNYAAQLRDPRWKQRRQEIIDKAGNVCEQCGESDNHLEVHHGYYLKGKMAWEYPDEILYCLCPGCHGHIQELMEIAHYQVAKRNLELYQLINLVHKNITIRDGNSEDGLDDTRPLRHYSEPYYPDHG